MERSMSTGSAAPMPARLRCGGRIALALLLVSSLTGCGAMRTALGVSKRPPDEFAIMTKAPLVMPPDFSLRPPQPGAEQPQVATPGEEARQTIFGLDAKRNAAEVGQSQGEFALLQKADAQNADAEIRETLNQDLVEPRKRRGFFGRMLHPFENRTAKADAVNPATEKARLDEDMSHPTARVDQSALPTGEPGATPKTDEAAPKTDAPEKEKKKHGFFHRLIRLGGGD